MKAITKEFLEEVLMSLAPIISMAVMLLGCHLLFGEEYWKTVLRIMPWAKTVYLWFLAGYTFLFGLKGLNKLMLSFLKQVN